MSPKPWSTIFATILPIDHTDLCLHSLSSTADQSLMRFRLHTTTNHHGISASTMFLRFIEPIVSRDNHEQSTSRVPRRSSQDSSPAWDFYAASISGSGESHPESFSQCEEEQPEVEASEGLDNFLPASTDCRDRPIIPGGPKRRGRNAHNKPTTGGEPSWDPVKFRLRRFRL